MGQCDYWWHAGGTQWCELKGSACKCGGLDESCGLRDKAVTSALEEEEKLTLQDVTARAKRRRPAEEAS